MLNPVKGFQMRETTIEKVKLPTTTVVEGEPTQPNEQPPNEDTQDEDNGSSS